jgi:hypothetical protein
VGVSIRQIGDELGRKAASLYRHIEALVDAGLIHETGSQISGGRDATTYAAPGVHMVLIAPSEEGPNLMRCVNTSCRSQSTLAEKLPLQRLIE